MEEGQIPPVSDTPLVDTTPSSAVVASSENSSPSDTSKLRSKKSLRTKIVVIILVILAIAIIAAIVYFVLRGVGIIKTPVDLTNVTTSSLDREIDEYSTLPYEEQSEESTELEDKTVAYAQKIESEKGPYDIETIRAYLSVAEYYFAGPDFNKSADFLQTKIDEINKIASPSADQIEAKILYGATLFNQYVSTNQVDKAEKVYTDYLEAIPDDAIMHENNWAVIRQGLIESLAQTRKNIEGLYDNG